MQGTHPHPPIPSGYFVPLFSERRVHRGGRGVNPAQCFLYKRHIPNGVGQVAPCLADPCQKLRPLKNDFEVAKVGWGEKGGEQRCKCFAAGSSLQLLRQSFSVIEPLHYVAPGAAVSAFFSPTAGSTSPARSSATSLSRAAVLSRPSPNSFATAFTVGFPICHHSQYVGRVAHETSSLVEHVLCSNTPSAATGIDPVASSTTMHRTITSGCSAAINFRVRSAHPVNRYPSLSVAPRRATWGGTNCNRARAPSWVKTGRSGLDTSPALKLSLKGFRAATWSCPAVSSTHSPQGFSFWVRGMCPPSPSPVAPVLATDRVRRAPPRRPESGHAAEHPVTPAEHPI